MNNAIGRRDFLKLGAGGAAVLASGSSLALLSGCSSGGAGPAEGFLHLRDSDLEVLRPWVPVILSDAARPNGDADIHYALQRLDGLLESVAPVGRKMLSELYDVMHLGAFRWWTTGYWRDPASLSEQEKIAALDAWEHKDSSFARGAFRGLCSPLLMAWYTEPDIARTTGYPGPPLKITG